MNPAAKKLAVIYFPKRFILMTRRGKLACATDETKLGVVTNRSLLQRTDVEQTILTKANVTLCIGQIEASTSPRTYPGHLTPLPSRGGGNLVIRVFQRVGNLIPMR